jgi:6-phosphogluconolactonase/glucosamine-6-phosphate isomerase/deaminase
LFILFLKVTFNFKNIKKTKKELLNDPQLTLNTIQFQKVDNYCLDKYYLKSVNKQKDTKVAKSKLTNDLVETSDKLSKMLEKPKEIVNFILNIVKSLILYSIFICCCSID